VIVNYVCRVVLLTACGSSISMSSSQSAPLYQFWALADDWHPGHVMLAANINTIYSPSSWMEAVVQVDGLWGEHKWMLYLQSYRPDFPYLPWIQVAPQNSPHDIITHAVAKKMWRIHPNQTHVHVINPAMLVNLKARLETIKATVAEPFHEIINSPLFASIQYPINAYAWAFKALDHLKREFTAW
jgi:hypothetical protein